MLLRIFVILLLPHCLLAQTYTAIENINVVDVTQGRIRPLQTVLIRNDKIAAIGRSLSVPAGAKTINGNGRYLLPGLIDMHVHLTWDSDSLMGISVWDQLQYLYLPNGITTIREASTRATEKQTIAAAKDTAHSIPRISASGRVDSLQMSKRGLTAAALTEELIRTEVHSIKIRNGLTMKEIKAVIQTARKHNIPVWGHTYYNDNDYTLAAVEAGVQGVTHVEAIAQTGANKRTDAPPADTADWEQRWMYGTAKWLFTDASATKRLIDRMVAKGVWLEPTLIVEDFIVNDRLLKELPQLTNSQTYKQDREGFPSPKGKDRASYQSAIKQMMQFVKQFHDAGGIIIAGSDGLSFPGFGLHEELRLLVDAGLSPADAIKAATINAAKVLGWQNTIGSIEKGKKADLVLLDGNPLSNIENTKTIAGVMINGRFLSGNKLQAMKKKAIEMVASKN